jgi:integrase
MNSIIASWLVRARSLFIIELTVLLLAAGMTGWLLIKTGWLERALLVRNGLMVALLALCPIRLKNFASLEIGQTFLRQQGGWWIILEDTKSGRADHRPVDSLLASCIGAYLNIYRPVLFAHASHRLDTPLEVPTALGMEKVSALWLGRHGRPLTYNAVERLITEITRMTIGVAVNPHRFRTSAATSAALHAPQSPHLGSALLQHSDPRVTQEHYIRASSLSVATDFTTLIANLRRRLSGCG